jgi:hypothetical protein
MRWRRPEALQHVAVEPVMRRQYQSLMRQRPVDDVALGMAASGSRHRTVLRSDGRRRCQSPATGILCGSTMPVRKRTSLMRRRLAV